MTIYLLEFLPIFAYQPYSIWNGRWGLLILVSISRYDWMNFPNFSPNLNMWALSYRSNRSPVWSTKIAKFLGKPRRTILARRWTPLSGYYLLSTVCVCVCGKSNGWDAENARFRPLDESFNWARKSTVPLGMGKLIYSSDKPRQHPRMTHATFLRRNCT